MTRPRIYLLNGAPRVGKDTTATAMVEKVLSSLLVKFAEPIKAALTATFCGNDRALFDSLDTPEQKDLPQKIFRGMTTRQAQIWYSEEIMKPKFGKMIFGELLAETIQRKNENGYVNFFVSDSGFRPEAEFLVETFGAESLYLFRLHREGYDFINKKTGMKDSRGHITLADLNVPEWDITNQNDSPELMIGQIYNIVKDAARF